MRIQCKWFLRLAGKSVIWVTAGCTVLTANKVGSGSHSWSVESWPGIHLPGLWVTVSGVENCFVLFVSHSCVVATVDTYVPVFASWVRAHRVSLDPRPFWPREEGPGE